jgi:3-oxoadipate enol-lactonase
VPFVESQGLRIHFEVTGRKSAPPVLMIQGLGASKHAWNLQRAALGLRWRTVALDNRGSGRSSRPIAPFTLEDLADDALRVLDAAGVDDAHVVGASMGGVVAQILAVRNPERVRSLVLACTSCRQHPWREDLLREWSTTARGRGLLDVGRGAAQWVMGPRSFRRAVPALGWLGPLAVLRPRDSFASQVDAILATDPSIADRLSEVTAPTLVVVGNQDILTPRGDSEELAERIPGAELVVISGAAHGLMVEHAGTFNSVLVDFLQAAERSATERSTAERRVSG